MINKKSKTKAAIKKPVNKKTKLELLLEQYEPIDWKAFEHRFIAGTDEVGRGCLAGPVYAAAVILDPNFDLSGLTDSKLIEAEARVEVAALIKERAHCWSIGVASVEEIGSLNILRASLLAMRRAVEGLKVCPEMVLIDGNQEIGGPWQQQTFVKGDLRCQPISAASIIAKVARDQFMCELDAVHPGYAFGTHKGYGTPEHRQAIAKLGPCAMHRRAFAGVKEYFELRLENFTEQAFID